MNRRPLILIIDDEEAIVSALSYVLQKSGYRTAVSDTGEEGLATARSARPDLILLDHCLPELSGSEVLRRLARDPRTSAIPVVVLSGSDVSQWDALSDGAAAFLRKPYRGDEFLDIVDSLLAQPPSITAAQPCPQRPNIDIALIGNGP